MRTCLQSELVSISSQFVVLSCASQFILIGDISGKMICSLFDKYITISLHNRPMLVLYDLQFLFEHFGIVSESGETIKIAPILISLLRFSP